MTQIKIELGTGKKGQARKANLRKLALTKGLIYNGQGSIGKLICAIADGDIEIKNTESEAKKSEAKKSEAKNTENTLLNELIKEINTLPYNIHIRAIKLYQRQIETIKAAYFQGLQESFTEEEEEEAIEDWDPTWELPLPPSSPYPQENKATPPPFPPSSSYP